MTKASFLGGVCLAVWSVASLAGCERKAAAPAVELPLRPLVYTETPGYDEERAAQEEAALLRRFERDGRLPTPQEMEQALDESPVGEQIGEDLLGELLGGPDDEPDPLEPPPLPDAQAPDVGAEAQVDAGAPLADPPTPPPDPVKVDMGSADALAKAVFEALMRQDEPLYERALIDGASLEELVGLPPEVARQRAKALRRAAKGTFRVCAPGKPSEEPEGGLISKLEVVAVKLGRGGTLQGLTPKTDDDVAQRWGTTIQFRLKHPRVPGAPEDKNVFTLTLGRMVRVPSGQWRLASAPELSVVFRAYLQAGLHLKPELMKPDHHPFPLSVGNFWRYRVRRPQGAARSTLDVNAEEVRLEVTGVEKHDGWRVIELRRTHKHGETDTEVLHYLMTPRRIYACPSYCAHKSDDLNYVLSFVRSSTPAFVFPLKAGEAWGEGGTRDLRSPNVLVRPKTEAAAVPAGTFNGALVLEDRRSDEGELRFFMPGVGVVQRVTQDELGVTLEELIEYRTLTTE